MKDNNEFPIELAIISSLIGMQIAFFIYLVYNLKGIFKDFSLLYNDMTLMAYMDKIKRDKEIDVRLIFTELNLEPDSKPTAIFKIILNKLQAGNEPLNISINLVGFTPSKINHKTLNEHFSRLLTYRISINYEQQSVFNEITNITPILAAGVKCNFPAEINNIILEYLYENPIKSALLNLIKLFPEQTATIEKFKDSNNFIWQYDKRMHDIATGTVASREKIIIFRSLPKPIAHLPRLSKPAISKLVPHKNKISLD